jgi:endonuclease YncB( thermonuclease family)
MLDEADVAFYQRRIEEVLRDSSPTEWQRQFLTDIRRKLNRYGAKTRLSDKQVAILKRLTQSPVKRPPLETVSAQSDQPRPHSSISTVLPFKKSHIERPRIIRPMRVQNPLHPPRLFRRSGAGRTISAVKGWVAISLMAMLMVFGLIGTFTSGIPNAEDRAETSLPVVAGAPTKAASVGRASFTITDGDTIRLNDGTRVRLVGFNTPEKFEPQCSAEAALGNRASARLKELVAGAGTTEVNLVPCACKPGTEGTKRCNYGRSCGTLSVDGRDVGQTLIAEGLAVSVICGATRCPPTPRPWCG